MLLGCSEKYKTSLQRVQNCLARVVTRSSRLSETRPLLKVLHWLPIKSRIKFKLNILTYKELLMGIPSYLSALLHFENRQLTLKSESVKLLILDRGQKEITAIHCSWLLHRVCGIIYDMMYVKQNESLSSEKN